MSAARYFTSAWLVVGCLSASACATTQDRESAFVIERRVDAAPERTFRALEETLTDRGLAVLFGHVDNGILAFEWPKADPKRTAVARSVVKISPSNGASSIQVRTSGYLPTSDPPNLSLGLEVGPTWVGRSDSAAEEDLIRAVEARATEDR